MKRIIYSFAWLCILMLGTALPKVSAQIYLRADSVRCGDTTTTLRATLIGATPTSAGITADDGYSGVISIGFSFNYYGTTYSSLIIGSNGVLCFNTGSAGAYCPWPISAALLGNASVRNCICGPWCDVYIPAGGTITYSTVGTAPNRKFAVTWCATRMYSCTSQWLTTQIIIYETSNLIETHIGHRTTGCGWNSDRAIVGVQNASGSAATAAPGRDFPTVWGATNEAWRFTPDTTFASYAVSSIAYGTVPYSSSSIHWYDSATGAYIGTGAVMPVPARDGRTYKATAAGCADSTFKYYHVDLSTLGGGITGTADFLTDIHLGCDDDTVYFRNLSTPAGGRCFWDFGDGSPIDSINANPRHIYATQGTYVIRLDYHVRPGCVITVFDTVDLNHPLSIAFTTPSNTLCLGNAMSFINGSVGRALTYYWSFGDGTSSTATDPTHVYSSTGVYKAELLITDSIGCQLTAQTFIRVVGIDVKAAFEDTTVCLRMPMEIKTSVRVIPINSTGVTYSWAPMSGLSAYNVPNPMFSGVGDFTYTVTATDDSFGCPDNAVVVIHSMPPLMLFNVTANATIGQGGSIQLNADGAFVYRWLPDDGTLDNANINNPVATPTDSVTVYTVYAMSVYGCKDTAQVIVKMDQTVTDVIPNAFSPNGDGLNDIFRMSNMRFQKLVDFRIFNRWGVEVFQTADRRKGWDGTYMGIPQDVGVYYYNIIVAHPDGQQKTYKGNFTLIR